MKTIQISKKQSDKIRTVMCAVGVVLGFGALATTTLMLLGMKESMPYFIGDLILLFAIYIFIRIRETKKISVLLSDEMATVSQTMWEDYWLTISFQKKSTKQETIYDVVYFDDGKQVLTETLTEKRFLEKIGDGSTHFKTVKRECSCCFTAAKVDGVICWLKLPWIHIEEEVVVPLYDLCDSLFKYPSKEMEEIAERNRIVLYGSEAVKPLEAEHLEYIKYKYLDNIAYFLSSYSYTRNHSVRLKCYLPSLSPETHKTEKAGCSTIYKEERF